MTYNGSGLPFWANLDSTIHAFPPVRGRYAPVEGGRWNVRRWEDIRSHKDGKVWHAWTNGRAKKYNHRFKTHAEAVVWAQRVAVAYKFRNESDLLAMHYEKYPSIKSKTSVRLYSGVLI